MPGQRNAVMLMQAPYDNEKTPPALDGVWFGRATRIHKRAARRLCRDSVRKDVL